MGSLFSKSKKESRVTAQDRAVLQLKQQRDKLKQYQKKLELNLERDRELARTLLKDGKKDKVRLLLRKKKFQEQLLEKTDGQLENLEHLVHDLEFAQIEVEVLSGLKTGNEALKEVHKLLNIEDVEKILEETRDGVEKQREIDELLSGALSQDDEDAVLEELDELIKSSLPTVPQDVDEIQLPDVPSEEPTKIATESKPQRQALEA